MLDQWLFLSTPLELAAFLFVVFLAGIVRGAIGFGFAAIVVAGVGFWLPPVPVICAVILLEGVASLILLAKTKSSINMPVLWRLTISGAISIVAGSILLASIAPQWLTIFITLYLAIISLLTLARVQFKTEVSLGHYTAMGFIAGFINGLAGIGGLLIAFFMTATRTKVGQIRATISASFLVNICIFLTSAYWQGLYTWKIVMTAAVCVIPLWVGTRVGSMFFSYLNEEQLKRTVLIALLVLSSFGLVKTLVNAM